MSRYRRWRQSLVEAKSVDDTASSTSTRIKSLFSRKSLDIDDYEQPLSYTSTKEDKRRPEHRHHWTGIFSQDERGKILEKRHGLFVLVNQRKDDRDAVDIVALHGLNGHWEKSWQATTPDGETEMWLRDFLPTHIPHARVMSFGYDSVVQFSKSAAHISIFAEQLLEELMARRQGVIEMKRPIIFVCHSLGGIVAKKAIIRAHESSRYSDILSSVRGIMFFGTPHRGSSVADWSRLLSNAASAATLGTSTNKSLLRGLETNSSALEEISRSFVDRAKPLQLISFYETDKMDYLKQRVVEEYSAILGFPNEVTIAMKGNHRSICRFSSIDDPRYRCVWTNLQNMSGSASTENNPESSDEDARPQNGHSNTVPRESARRETLRTDDSDPEESQIEDFHDNKATMNNFREEAERKRRDSKRHQRLNSTIEKLQQERAERARPEVIGLDDSDQDDERIVNFDQSRKRMNSFREAAEKTRRDARKHQKKLESDCLVALSATQYQEHRHRIPEAVDGTCQWILTHEKYQTWLRKSSPELLWLSADPGCGKSVLISNLVSYLQQVDNKVHVPEVVCYFFFKEDNEEQNNATNAVQALLHQLYTAQPWLIKHAIETYLRNDKMIPFEFPRLWDVFMKSVSDPKSRDVLIILDGLDECESNTRSHLLKALSKLHKSEESTRDGSALVKTIIASRPDNDIKICFDMLPTIRLRGEDEPEAISKDVELVIQHHLDKAALRGLPEKVLSNLRAGLLKGADRTFLWVTLVIELLHAQRGASERELLDILQSRDIYRIYQKLIDNSPDRRQAKRLLAIIVAAARPMTLAEMSVAVAISPTHRNMDELDLDIVHNFEERIKDICGNFVRVVRSTIYLVHQTAREFLLHNDSSRKSRDQKDFGPWQHSIVLNAARHKMLNICLQYLLLLTDDILSFSRPSQEFLNYAAKFWTVHYAEIAPRVTTSQISSCIRLCNTRTAGFKRWFPIAASTARNYGQRIREGQTQRDLAYSLGLDEVVAALERFVDFADLEYKEAPESDQSKKHPNTVEAVTGSPQDLFPSEIRFINHILLHRLTLGNHRWVRHWSYSQEFLNRNESP